MTSRKVLKHYLLSLSLTCVTLTWGEFLRLCVLLEPVWRHVYHKSYGGDISLDTAFVAPSLCIFVLKNHFHCLDTTVADEQNKFQIQKKKLQIARVNF